MYTVLLVIHSILVLFLIGMVLIQRSDSDGLSGLGGGGGGNQFLTGRGQATLMTRTTAILAAAFMATSLLLAVMAGRANNRSIIDTVPVKQETPAVTAPKAPPAAKEAPKPETPTPAVPKPE